MGQLESRVRGSILAILAVLVSGAALIGWAAAGVFPMVGNADPMLAIGPKDLADLSIQSVQYVQTLTMAVFGGAMILLSQGFLGQFRATQDAGRRTLVAIGFVLLALSLATGFAEVELLIEAADQRVVDDKMPEMRNLRLLQSGFLMLGVILIGGASLLDIVRGSGSVS